jgi:hypothetical protein
VRGIYQRGGRIVALREQQQVNNQCFLLSGSAHQSSKVNNNNKYPGCADCSPPCGRRTGCTFLDCTSTAAGMRWRWRWGTFCEKKHFVETLGNRPIMFLTGVVPPPVPIRGWNECLNRTSCSAQSNHSCGRPRRALGESKFGTPSCFIITCG